MTIKFNRANFKRVLDHIKAHPKTWNQSRWHCGTSHCLAGHAQIMSGNDPDNYTVRRDARLFLGLSLNEANYIFSATRTIADFDAVLDVGIYNRAGYDSDSLDINNNLKPSVAK